MQPGYGQSVIIPHAGNIAPLPPFFGNSDDRVMVGSPANFRAPALTTQPPMPLLERITPRSVNATALTRTTVARATVRATTVLRTISQTAAGYARAVTLRVNDAANRARQR